MITEHWYELTISDHPKKMSETRALRPPAGRSRAAPRGTRLVRIPSTETGKRRR